MDDEGVEFVVKTREGLELITDFSQFIYEVTRVYVSEGLYDLEKSREALDRLGLDLRKDPRILLRQLDVHRLSATLRAPIYSDNDEDHEPERWPAPYWTGPDSPQEQIDYWIKVQETGTASLRKRDR